MSGIYGDIGGALVMNAGQSIRRNLADNDFESYDPYIPTARTQAPASRSLNSAFIPSSTSDALVTYSVSISCNLSLSGGASGFVALEISANGTTGWTEVCRATNGNTGTLTIGLNTTQVNSAPLSAFVPAGYSVRLRTSNTTGTPSYGYISGQETLL